jgi:hypothetical protein
MEAKPTLFTISCYLGKLAGLAPQLSENKLTLAQALKQHWIGNEKWEGKLSKKQRSKVEKIKSILGGA